jgi:hypothetical protein
MSAVHKVIVTNIGALRKKHGTAGTRKIVAAVDKLVKADASRGVVTRFIAFDRKSDMKDIGKAVGKATDRRVESDLPYACSSKYGTDINDFLGPTRVIGRLSDVAGRRDSARLVRLLRTASDWKSRTRRSYGKCFGITAEAWKHSTRTSVRKLFGTQKGVNVSPDDGPNWTKGKLAKRIHFINCHGDTANSISPSPTIRLAWQAASRAGPSSPPSAASERNSTNRSERAAPASARPTSTRGPGGSSAAPRSPTGRPAATVSPICSASTSFAPCSKAHPSAGPR